MTLDEKLLKNDERAIYALRALYRRYGYTQFKMSKFEEYDLYVRNKSFLVSDHMITFTDTDGRLLALKPDVTLSIVKNVKNCDEGLCKLYYNENVYRSSGEERGIREIMQVGLECIGDIDDYAIYEVLSLAAESLALISGDYVLNVSDVRILLSVLNATGLSPAGKAQALKCVSEKNAHGITAICREEGVDGTALVRLASVSGALDTVLPVLREIACEDNAAVIEEFLSTVRRLEEGGRKNKIRVDFSVISDTKYYNALVFKGFVNGIASAVLSGGEYDNLMAKMGKKAKALGFAVYLDLLERFSDEDSEYDVDVLLLYGESTPVDKLASKVVALTDKGERVLAVRKIPEDITYRQLVSLTGEEEK